MDILVIKKQNGLIDIEPIKYAKFKERERFFGGEQITFMDKVKHIIEEKTDLKVYKIGWYRDWTGPDGHGGGEYWDKLHGSYVNELDKMKSEHLFNPDALDKINDIQKRCNNQQYYYVIPYLDQKSQTWHFLINDNAAYFNNDKVDIITESINYKNLFTRSLEHANTEIGVFYNIENYSLEKIENTPLLSEVDHKEIFNLICPAVQNQNVNKLTLAQLSTAVNTAKLFEQYISQYLATTNTIHDNGESQSADKPSPFINTPSIVEQYNNLKSQSNADRSVLLMQCGKFYNAFGSDAEKISDVTKVKLISRKPENIPMIGIPVDKFEIKYKELLTNAGLNVTVSNVIDKHFSRQSSEYSSTSQSVLEASSSSSFTHS